MAFKKKLKEQTFFGQRFTKSIIGTSVGANILERTGGSVALGGAQGLQSMANFFPVIGGIYGVKSVMGLLQQLPIKQKQTRRQR